MDEFFNGLDCRLRVSGMVADSIMMGIVNSTMESAFQKSCSKEGDLERLNEKSRFCELAIMQLEWCLKYLQEEIDSYIVESAGEREKLLCELLQTRDRIQNRLEETELDIVRKDVELMETKKSNSSLRLALEMKDDEISSLRAALDLERERNESTHAFQPCGLMVEESNGSPDFSETKNTVDEHVQRIRGKLEDGRSHLTDILHKLNIFSLHVMKLANSFSVGIEEQPSNNSRLLLEQYGNNREKAKQKHSDCRLIENLNQELKEISGDMNILSEKLGPAFEMMESSISLLKTAMDQKQWKWNVERGTIDIILRSFVRDVLYNFEQKPGADKLHAVMSDTYWSAFMEEITSLCYELEMLINQKNGKAKNFGGADAGIPPNPSLAVNASIKDNSDSEKAPRTGSSEFSGSVDNSCHVSKTHGNLGDASMDAGKLITGEDLSVEDASEHFVAEMVRTHESIIRQKSEELKWQVELSRQKATIVQKDKDSDSVKRLISRIISRLKCIMQKNSYESDTRALQDDLLQCETADTIPWKEIRKLKRENKDLEIKAMILEDTYEIIFKGLLRSLNLEFFNYEIETFIRENTYCVAFNQMVAEWSHYRKTYDIERLVSRDMDHIVFSEAIKNIKFTVNSASRDIEGNTLPKSLQSLSIIDKADQRQEVDSKSDHFTMLGEHLEVLDSPTSHDISLSEARKESLVLAEQGDALIPVNENQGESLQHIVHRNVQLREFSPCSGLPGNDKHVAHDHLTCLSMKELQFALVHLTKATQLITDFENTTSKQIRVNMSRLEDLNCQVNFLAEEVKSIKKKEILYRQAFTRRCHDLQMAEAEVDLLGDEVDLLVGFLEKIYIALDHYSPVLQNYCGIPESCHGAVQQTIMKRTSIPIIEGR